MSSRASLTVILCLGFLSPLATAVNLRPAFSGLLDNSPFGRSASPVTMEKAADPIEFRAVLDENNIRYFSLFDGTARRSIWLVLNSTVNEITAREYNPATMTISVEYRGKPLSLPLKGAKGQMWTARVESAPRSRTAPTEMEYGDRPFRIGHVLEEAEIRQAVRQE
jgi:hypothetical protein